MNDSRAEPMPAAGRRRTGRGLAATLLVAAALSLTAAAAPAQTTIIQSDPDSSDPPADQPAAPGVSAPIMLAPLNEPAPATAPATAPAPGQPAVEAAPSLQSAPQPRTLAPAKGIEVGTLKEIELDSLGVLDPGAGGLGLEAWSGSDRSVIERLLARLPGTIASPTLRDLAVRLLLTSATAPIRQTLASANGTDNSLLRLRLDRLAALGETAGLNALLAAIPLRFDDEAVARLRVNGLLLENDLEGACRTVQNGITLYHQAVFWPKALVFCQLAEGQTDQAMLGLDLLRETESSDDPGMAALMSHVAGTPLPELQGSAVDVLAYAILRQFGLPLPADLAAKADLGLAVALAKTENAPLELRVAAAERAAASGAAEAALLGQVYDSFIFSPEELNGAISAAAALEGAAGRALLYQAARQQPIAVARAEILRVMLEAALAEGSYPALLPLLLPILADVPALPELDWFAETAARALFVGRRFEQAAAWTSVARQAEANETEPTGMTSGIWPYERLAGAAPQDPSIDLAAWRRLREDSGRGDAAAQQGLLLLAFRALGESDPLSWAQVTAGRRAEATTPPQSDSGSSETLSSGAMSSGAPALDAAVLYALIDAGSAGRLGETVLLSLILLGEAGPGAGNPVALGAVLTMLTQVGLGQEARALAMEVAVGSRI